MSDISNTGVRPEPMDAPPPEVDYVAVAERDHDDEDDLEALDEGDLNTAPDPKVSLEKADRSLAELHRWYGQGRIIVDPEWQRNYVWDRARASKLIESFLLDIPVPVVYLAKTPDGKYEVIDGLQRLTSVFEFFENKYKLQRLDMLADFAGKHFRDLPPETQHKLEDAVLRSFELSTGAGDMHFVVFERLNTGGIKLNDMEIRNCLYRGPLNQLIKDLAQNTDFRRCLNQAGIDKRMHDRSLVLRFLAFYERTHHKCQYGLKKFLNEFLETYRDAKPEKIDEYRSAFETCMRASVSVFGESAFRLKNEMTKPRSKSAGEWATRPNAAIFQAVATSFANYDLGAVTRAADAIYEDYLDLINTDAQWVDYVRRATGETTRLTYAFDTWYARLRDILSQEPPNDARRAFSRQLKKEMWDGRPVCAICNQQIKLLDDAVLDHDKRYWLGGKTIPDNARLAHRLCNLQRG